MSETTLSRAILTSDRTDYSSTLNYIGDLKARDDDFSPANRTGRNIPFGNGRLALAGLADARIGKQISSITTLTPISAQDSTDVSQEVGTVIDRNDPDQPFALARYAQKYPVNEADLKTLTAWAESDTSSAERREFLLGILHQKKGRKTEGVSAAGLRDQIAAWPMDAVQRRTETQLVVEEVLAMSTDQQAAVLKGLVELRDHEEEPEVRIELSNMLLECSRRRFVHGAGFQD